MKYKAIIETDDFEDFEFFEDGNGKYIRGIDAGAVNNEWIVVYFTECKQEPVLDKMRAEIIKYEGDCRLSVDEYPSCKQCTDNVFETIYGIIDKYKAESEDKE